MGGATPKAKKAVSYYSPCGSASSRHGVVCTGKRLADSFDPKRTSGLDCGAPADGKGSYWRPVYNRRPKGGATVTRNHIPFEFDGTLDTVFQPTRTGWCMQSRSRRTARSWSAAIWAHRRTDTYYIARLDPTTGLADCSPQAEAVLSFQSRSRRMQDFGRRHFTSIGGKPRTESRGSIPTGLADSFDRTRILCIFKIAVQPDGKILAGGFFTSIGGQPRNYIARLDPITGLADSSTRMRAVILVLAVQADSKIFGGWRFPRNELHRRADT